MCNGNTDLVTMMGMETQSNPFLNFSISHWCRDFDTFAEWRKNNSVDMEKQVPAPRMNYELFGTEEEKAAQLPF